MVSIEQLRQPASRQLGRCLGRADDVGEQHRRQHTGRAWSLSHPGQELLDLIDDRVGVADAQEMVVALEFDSFAPGICESMYLDTSSALLLSAAVHTSVGRGSLSRGAHVHRQVFIRSRGKAALRAPCAAPAVAGHCVASN